jgi:hypothetical protein
MSKYGFWTGVSAILATTAITFAQGQDNQAKLQPLLVKFHRAVAKGHHTLLVFEVTNPNAVPVSYRGGAPRVSESGFKEKVIDPFYKMRLLQTETGKAVERIQPHGEAVAATVSAKGSALFEVDLPAAEFWDELSVGISWFERNQDRGPVQTSWSTPIPRKNTEPRVPEAGKTEDPDLVAIGNWSEPVNGLRGRLLIKPRPKTPGAVLYMDLHHCADAIGEPLNVYVDPKLQPELFDPQGKLASRVGLDGSGWRPEPFWQTIPHDCTLRVCLTTYEFDLEQQLVIMHQLRIAWHAPVRGVYAMTATFTNKAPEKHGRERVWEGTLTLPKAKIALNH